jgi:hypothetical protein
MVNGMDAETDNYPSLPYPANKIEDVCALMERIQKERGLTPVVINKSV